MHTIPLRITATERTGTVGFYWDGGHTITDDDTGEVVGGTYNQQMSTTLAWRGRKFRVSHLDLLRAVIGEISPADLDAYDESLTEGSFNAGT